MESTLETVEGLEQRLAWEVPAETIENDVNAKLKDLTGKAKLKGFRPGKVPFDLIKKRYDASVRAEVIEKAVEASFRNLVVEHKLALAGRPNIDFGDYEAGGSLKLTATFEVLPEFDLVTLEGQTIEKVVCDVADEDIDEVLEQLRDQHADWNEVEREAKDGDKIRFDFKGFLNDEPFQGGEAKDYELQLGSKSMIPGFEEALIGVKAGEERTFDVTFPEDYPSKDLAGQKTQFKTTTHAVLESTKAEVNEDFVKKFDIEDGTVEGLREELKSSLARNVEREVNARLRKTVVEKLQTLNEMQLPKALVTEEMRDMRQQTLSRMGVDANQLKDDDEKFPLEQYREQAENRVKLGLVFDKVITQFDIKPDSGKMQQQMRDMMADFQDPTAFLQLLEKNPQFRNQLESQALEESAIDRLVEDATISEKKMTYKSLLKGEDE